MATFHSTPVRHKRSVCVPRRHTRSCRANRLKAYEQRSFRSSNSKEHPTSQPKQCLLFPQSDNNVLLKNSTWQPRGSDNRIKILLSERLVNQDGSLDTGSWDIVCFSFQHAHRGTHTSNEIHCAVLTLNRAVRAGRHCISNH